jgi:hypothetical protein
MITLKRLFVSLLMVALTSTMASAKNDETCPGKSCEAKEKAGVISRDDTLTDVSIDAESKASVLLNGRNDFKADIRTKHIYYVGETLSVFVKFSRGIDILADELADAHIIVVTPNTDAYSFPVDSSIGPQDRKFFSLDIENAETLPLGQYQLGLVVTIPGGDPLDIKDWYNGFRGLLDMEGIYISDQPLPEDVDADGECDADADGDGFCEDKNTDDDDNVDPEPLPGGTL